MVMAFHETKMQINSFGNLIQMISALSRGVRSHTWSVTTSGNIGIIISLPLTGETCWLLDCWTIKSPCQLIDVFPKGLNHVGLICMCDKLRQLWRPWMWPTVLSIYQQRRLYLWLKMNIETLLLFAFWWSRKSRNWENVVDLPVYYVERQSLHNNITKYL